MQTYLTTNGVIANDALGLSLKKKKKSFQNIQTALLSHHIPNSFWKADV